MRQISVALALATASLSCVLAPSASAQQISEAVQNQIRVKFINATRAYEAGNYTEALSRLEEIEGLSGGSRIPTAQGLKVKTLVGLERWDAAREELAILFSSSPSDGVLSDVAPFAGQIDEHFAAIAERERQATLARQREDDAWANAQGADSEDSYAQYLESYPDGRYNSAAQSRFEDLREAREAAMAEQRRLAMISGAPSYISNAYAAFQQETAELNIRIEEFNNDLNQTLYQIAGPVQFENWERYLVRVRAVGSWIGTQMSNRACKQRLLSNGWTSPDSFCEGNWAHRKFGFGVWNVYLDEMDVRYERIISDARSPQDLLDQAKARCELVKNEPIYAEVEELCAELSGLVAN